MRIKHQELLVYVLRWMGGISSLVIHQAGSISNSPTPLITNSDQMINICCYIYEQKQQRRDDLPMSYQKGIILSNRHKVLKNESFCISLAAGEFIHLSHLKEVETVVYSESVSNILCTEVKHLQSKQMLLHKHFFTSLSIAKEHKIYLKQNIATAFYVCSPKQFMD